MQASEAEAKSAGVGVKERALKVCAVLIFTASKYLVHVLYLKPLILSCRLTLCPINSGFQVRFGAANSANSVSVTIFPPSLTQNMGAKLYHLLFTFRTRPREEKGFRAVD